MPTTWEDEKFGHHMDSQVTDGVDISTVGPQFEAEYECVLVACILIFILELFEAGQGFLSCTFSRIDGNIEA